MKPLDHDLDQAILTISRRFLPGGFDISPNAPASYRALRKHLDAGKRMTVFSGGCTNIIYGAPHVNRAFRAWHDLCRWQAGFDFSVQGEIDTWRLQYQQLQQVFGHTLRTRMWGQILHAEIVRQRPYYERHREYLVDQRAFVECFLENPEAALRRQTATATRKVLA